MNRGKYKVSKTHVYISHMNHTDVTFLYGTHNHVKRMWFFPPEKLTPSRLEMKRLTGRDIYIAFVFQQGKGRSVCSSSCMRCCRRRTCAAASGGFSRQTVHSSSHHRTKRSWLRCGASARATAKPWRTRRWHALCVTTRAPERSAKWSASSRISLTRQRSGGCRATYRNSPKPNCSNDRMKIQSLGSGRTSE